PHSSPKWNGFVEKLDALLPQADAVIYDLRGNSGGDDSKGSVLARRVAGCESSIAYNGQYKLMTPEALAFRLGLYRIWTARQKARGQNTAWLEKSAEELEADYDRAKAGEV